MENGISWRSLLILVVYGCSLLLIALGGGTRVLTKHEVLAAEPARQMLHGRGWVIPSFAGIERMKKPPTTGWLIAASMGVSRSESEFVVRLPCALAGVLCGALVALFASRYFGETVGMVAGLMQITTVATLMQARLAEADMPLCAAVIAAMYFFCLANVPRDGEEAKRWWLAPAFGFCAGVAFLFKGPVGLVFIYGGVVAYIVGRREWKRFWFLLHPIGLLLMLGCVLGWPIAALRENPEIRHVWWREIFGRAAGELGTPEPVWQYLVTIPVMMLPWTPFVILGVIEWVRDKRPFVIFCACWFSVGFVVLSASSFKHKHYSIPILPPLVIAGAVGLVAHLRRQFEKGKTRPAVAASILILICAIAAGTVLWIAKQKNKWPMEEAAAISGILVIVAIGGTLMLVFEHRKRLAACLISLFGTVWTAAVLAQALVMPFHDGYRVHKELALRVNEMATAIEPIYLLRTEEIQPAFYLRFPYTRVEDREQIERLLKDRSVPRILALLPEDQVAWVESMRAVEILDRPAQTNARGRPEDKVVLARLTLR